MTSSQTTAAPPQVRPPDLLPWIRAGLAGLPLYGLLTLWAAREPQPNPDEEYAAWSRFVTEPEYVVTHVLGSGLGVVLVVFGTFALGAYLARTRAARAGLWAMTLTVFGQCLVLFFTGYSAFGPPVEGAAYLAGRDLRSVSTGTVQTAAMLVMLVAVLTAFVGNVLLGVAVIRSRALPAWSGWLWILAALLMYPFGIVLGALTIGATPVTVPVGAGVVTLSGAWMLWHTLRPAGVRDSAGDRAGAWHRRPRSAG